MSRVPGVSGRTISVPDIAHQSSNVRLTVLAFLAESIFKIAPKVEVAVALSSGRRLQTSRTYMARNHWAVGGWRYGATSAGSS